MITIFTNCSEHQPKAKLASTVNAPVIKSATVNSLKVGDAFTFPIIALDDTVKALKINSYIINASLGDEYNSNNLKAKLETQKKELEKSYQGLTSLDYKIVFNNPSILSISISSCWTGNRENCEEVQYNFDINTGYSFGLDQIIIPSKKYEIEQLIIAELEKRLNEVRTDLKKDGRWDSYYESAISEELVQVHSKLKLSDFKLSEKGISFVYNSTPFAMADRAFFPLSDYFYSWATLRPYLLDGNPITPLIK